MYVVKCTMYWVMLYQNVIILVVSVCILCSVVHSHLHYIVTVTKHAQCVCIISGLIDELLQSWSDELSVVHTPQH